MDIIERAEVYVRDNMYHPPEMDKLIAALKAARAENERLKDLVFVLQGGGV